MTNAKRMVARGMAVMWLVKWLLPLSFSLMASLYGHNASAFAMPICSANGLRYIQLSDKVDENGAPEIRQIDCPVCNYFNVISLPATSSAHAAAPSLPAERLRDVPEQMQWQNHASRCYHTRAPPVAV
tara:strand:- start:155 stop:538 length:384 start_codon:yes stop_codon:yes gene_type:complete